MHFKDPSSGVQVSESLTDHCQKQGSPKKIAGSKLKMSSVIDTMNLRQAEHLAGEFLAASKDEGLKTVLEICTVVEVLKIDTL